MRAAWSCAASAPDTSRVNPTFSASEPMNKPSIAALSLVLATLSACDNTHTRGTEDSGIPVDATTRVDAFTATDTGCAGGICACSPDVNPFRPTACSVEGERCGSTGGACGGGTDCTCTAGLWQCRVAEPDPACWCGREPTMGSPCNTEGMGCGACCPGPGEWPALQCVGGRWAAAACPPVECPDHGCPVDRPGAVGTSCPSPGTRCGNACCSSPIQCDPATRRWVALPEADCICSEPDFVCGEGSCTADRDCISECGPADGIIFSCHSAPDGCTGCGCYPGQACEVRDGHVFVLPSGFCG